VLRAGAFRHDRYFCDLLNIGQHEGPTRAQGFPAPVTRNCIPTGLVMLVKFDSEVGSVTMFGDVAIAVLKMMGHSGTVPSALLADDIPAALQKLKSGLAMTSDASDVRAENNQDDKPPPVSLRQRAFPLVELLERAAARRVDITWK